MGRLSTGFWLPVAGLVILAIAHIATYSPGEPFKNGDETRHVMTGVFVRDALADFPSSAAHPSAYAQSYYVQYPALGIIVWPPFFYLVEGLAMWLFGTHYFIARIVIYLFALMAGIYCYLFVARTHGRVVAGLTLLLTGFAPLIFDLSSYVLLEVPTLALVMATIFHFERYLEGQRSRDALLACILAALAALTRFDGVMLLPYVLIRLGFARQFQLLLRRPVILGVLVALSLTVPYYLFTWRVYGSGLQKAAMSGTGPQSTALFDAQNFVLYPSFIPEQAGWPATIAAAVGLVFALGRDRRRCGPLFALLAATYLTFVPMAEPESRHAIYWVPALAALAALGIRWVKTHLGLYGAVPMLLLVVGGTGWEGVRHAGAYVRGNKAAAEFVVAHARGDRPVMIEGVLNGGFIYYVRLADDHRRLGVIRGDKLLYAVLSDPHGRYDEFAKTDQEVLDLLHQYDPEFIVVEQPQLLFDLPAATRLRQVLQQHPDRFPLERTIPYESNHRLFTGARLEIYRKRDRNPTPTGAAAVPVLGLGRTIRGR